MKKLNRSNNKVAEKKLYSKFQVNILMTITMQDK